MARTALMTNLNVFVSKYKNNQNPVYFCFTQLKFVVFAKQAEGFLK